MLDESGTRSAEEADVEEEGVVACILTASAATAGHEIVGDDDVGPIEGEQLSNEHGAIGSGLHDGGKASHAAVTAGRPVR